MQDTDGLPAGALANCTTRQGSAITNPSSLRGRSEAVLTSVHPCQTSSIIPLRPLCPRWQISHSGTSTWQIAYRLVEYVSNITIE